MNQNQNYSASNWEQTKRLPLRENAHQVDYYLYFWPFSGIRQTISVEIMIKYLKEWCIKPADKQELRQPDDVLEGAEFTSTVQHIHNVYNYLYQNCPKGTLKELFHHSPAVFIEYNRYTLSSTFLNSCWNQVTTYFDPTPSGEMATGVQGVSTTWRRCAGVTQQACFSATNSWLMQQTAVSCSPKSSLPSTIHWKAWETSSSMYASLLLPFRSKQIETNRSSTSPLICYKWRHFALS